MTNGLSAITIISPKRRQKPWIISDQATETWIVIDLVRFYTVEDSVKKKSNEVYIEEFLQKQTDGIFDVCFVK